MIGRPQVTPGMQAWIDEQMKFFPPGSMDGLIKDVRMFERVNRERARHVKAGEAA